MQHLLSIYIPLIQNWLSLEKNESEETEREGELERRDIVADYKEADRTSKLGVGSLCLKGGELSVYVKLSK